MSDTSHHEDPAELFIDQIVHRRRHGTIRAIMRMLEEGPARSKPTPNRSCKVRLVPLAKRG